MAMKDRLTRIQELVMEIQELEKCHLYDECQRYAPGRCPICFRIRMLEQDEIEREVVCVEEDLAIALEEEHGHPSLLERVRTLATVDVYRCHARGKWPLSLAEVRDRDAIEKKLYRRLEVKHLPQDQQKRLYPLLVLMIEYYQDRYYEACKERWPLDLFKHYNSPLQVGNLSIDWAMGLSYIDMEDVV